MAASTIPALMRRAGAGLAAVALVLLGAAAIVPRPAQAGGPEYAQALADWLADDEAAALPALALLAEAGDGRARLLLGLIDRSASLQGPWLSQRSRAERLAVMRAPGGLSGQSWLSRIDSPAELVPLARLWQALLQVGTGLDTVEAFYRIGEPRAARQAVLTMAMREELSPGTTWPEWLDIELAWAVWPFAREDLRADILRRLPQEHPQRALIVGTPVSGTDPARAAGNLEQWLERASVTQPLRALCAALCPDSEAACRLAAYQALGSHGAVLTLGSPAEALIPDAVFLTSARGQQAMLRRMLLSTDMRGRAALLSRTEGTDACLGDHLAAAAGSYRPNRTEPARNP